MPRKFWWLIVSAAVIILITAALSYWLGLFSLIKYIYKGTPQSPPYTFNWQQPTYRSGEIETSKLLLRGIVSGIDSQKKILWVLTKYGTKKLPLNNTINYKVAVVTKNLPSEGPHVQAWISGEWLTIYDINIHNKKQQKFIVSTQELTPEQWLLFAKKRSVVEMIFGQDKKTLYGLTLVSWK